MTTGLFVLSIALAIVLVSIGVCLHYGMKARREWRKWIDNYSARERNGGQKD